MHERPIIGITPSPSLETMPHGTFERFAMATTYVDAILAAGGIPLVLPPQEDHAAVLTERIDGLLLSGGGDVAPERYGTSDVHPTTYGVHALRDRFELELVDAANARNMPILGICRGLQLLNVAYGGTLVQDVASSESEALEHRQHETKRAKDDLGHQVRLDPNSVLAAIYGQETIGVNSFHHQAIDAVGDGLTVIGRATDDVIEAVADARRPFVLAVQWHPEMLFERHADHLELFRSFVRVAARQPQEV